MKRVVHLSAGIAALAIVLTGPTFVAHSAVHAAPLGPPPFTQGHLVVSRSVYQGFDTLITVGQALPGGGTATVNGSYPGVWANEGPDASFGVTAPIFLDEMTTGGTVLQSVPVDTGQVVTSFSSKSEIALNLSSDGTALTFMGYVAPVNALDVSNSNTPNHVDSTNPVAEIDQRAVGQIDATQHLQVTPVDAYSGNNGRAVIAAKAADGNFYFYMVGNAGNGGDPEPVSVVDNTGVQMTTPLGSAETMVVGAQQGTPGSACGFQFGFSIAFLGLDPCTTVKGTKQDKSGKDDNFRGITIFNNTLYVTKGSGSNGVNSVYKVDDGSLPTPASASTTSISLLPGLPTTLARATPASTVMDPFGIWFANATTLYVADEGNGSLVNQNAGLQKWTFDGAKWNRAYVLQAGLNRGTPYSIDGYPTNLNPATDGLRNITGTVNGDGTATIYAVTSTISASTDQGADPNKIVVITDTISAPTLPANEQFTDVRTAKYAEVLRGVSFAPRTLPSPVATAQPPANGAGWEHTPVTVSLTATADASGIQDLQYSSSGAQASSTQTIIGTSGMVNVLKEGTTILSVLEQNVLGSRSPATTLTLNLDFTPPTVTAAANATALWPPNGKMVPITVTGTITDGLSGVDPASAAFHVVDSYGTVQPSGPIAIGPDGSYSFTTFLEASRLGSDKAGRVYEIFVSAGDRAGNNGSTSVVVTVPHNQ